MIGETEKMETLYVKFSVNFNRVSFNFTNFVHNMSIFDVHGHSLADELLTNY